MLNELASLNTTLRIRIDIRNILFIIISFDTLSNYIKFMFTIHSLKYVACSSLLIQILNLNKSNGKEYLLLMFSFFISTCIKFFSIQFRNALLLSLRVFLDFGEKQESKNQAL